MLSAIVGLAGIVLAAALLVVDPWFDRSTVDDARRKQSIAIEEILARFKNRVATTDRPFDEQQLTVTGAVEANRLDSDGMPVLFLRLPRGRAVEATLNDTPKALRRIGEGDRVSMDCESVRLLGRKDPYIGLRGCEIL